MNEPLVLYDTARRRKVPFEPADPERITMYVCGPTVYDRAHIGNFRPAVVFDVLARLLRYKYGEDALVYARNITDIDDKIMARADAEGRAIEEVTAEAEADYLADAAALGIELPSLAPHATQHVPHMIAMMERLVARGHAYAAEGHVLFDVTSDGDYGTLSGRPMEEMIAGARVEVAPYKKNAADFVLWKPSEEGQVGWDSPWGRGRPGWHIECSAMIGEHLGETIDIHGGGQDLVFPHHENEAAQSRCVHGGAPLARYWLHNGFLSVDAEKMSKSLGNVVTIPKLLEAGHRGETIRLALLMAHYRQPLDWTETLLQEAKSQLDYFYGLLRRAQPNAGRFDPIADTEEGRGEDIDVNVELSLADDLNTPQAISRLHQLAASLANSLPLLERGEENDPALGYAAAHKHKRNLLRAAALLGLLQVDPEIWFTGGGDSRIDGLVFARTAAKQRRDFAEADRIRDELAKEGVILEDRPDGTRWRRE